MMKTKLCHCRWLFMLISVLGYADVNAQNLLDMQNWAVGTGSSGAFAMNGQTIENTRFWGEGPQGQRAVLWEAKPEGTANDDGGFNHNYFAIDHTKMYRFSIWLKKTNSNDGSSYFGTNNVTSLDGSPNNNPYFWSGDLPELNKWYLVVGYIHGSGDVSTTHYGGIYDGLTGIKAATIDDFKFAVGTGAASFRSYLYYDPNTNDRQYFYSPRVEVVNGDEPTIAALLGISNGTATQGYFSGNVGIKTQTPGSYELAVNGKIRTKEVKVEASNWPDYVFEESHQIPSLVDLEKYIKTYKHLPEMPTAKEVETNGVYLGEMNKLLLKKIEELTLHLIELKKENIQMQHNIQSKNSKKTKI